MIPVLPGYTHDRHIFVWCSHCKKFHMHGAGGPDNSGHVVAHCFDPLSLYYSTGYIIDDRGPASAEMVKDFQRARPRGPASKAGFY